MFQSIRRYLTPSTAIAFVALVFAVTGGAFAASGGGASSPSHATLTAIATKAKSKTKAGARGPAGPKGATGANGATGLAGPAGPAGAAGAKGETGAAGANGTNGEKGEKGEQGVQGIQGHNGTNGTNGTNGETGFTKTLPAGETETGAWSFAVNGESVVIDTPISFSIPLAEPLSGNPCTRAEEPCQVHYINAAGEESTVANGWNPSSAACKGSVSAPTAQPGNLCVYERELQNANVTGPYEISNPGSVALSEVGAGTYGAILRVEAAGGLSHGFGSWAVTAPAS